MGNGCKSAGVPEKSGHLERRRCGEHFCHHEEQNVRSVFDRFDLVKKD